MKKSLWLTLAVAAVAALFVVAGCAPAPPPDPTPTPDVTPTPAPVDDCPTDVETMIVFLSDDCPIYNNNNNNDANVRLVIRFDEEIFVPNVVALQNVANWDITITRWLTFEAYNDDLEVWEDFTWISELELIDDWTAESGIEVTGVSLQPDNKTIWVDLIVVEWADDIMDMLDDEDDEYQTVIAGWYCGLVCNEDQYKNWLAGMNYVGPTVARERIRASEPIYADEIAWSVENLQIYDVNLNFCADLCEISDVVCCLIEVCPEDPDVAPCPIL